ncbi:MAG TPA: hypothetical protein VMN04_14320 [Thermoanaerobaculia bacterium]|nr:hypothetical protein [Thermoanaerobaculia bacterium]
MKPSHAAACALFAVALGAAAAGPTPKVAPRDAAPAAIESEASLEYFIGLASRLAQQDSAARLQALQKQLDLLLAEKNALQAKLLAEQRALAGAEAGGDGAKAQALRNALQALQAQLAPIDVEVQKILSEIQELRDDENSVQDEAKRGADLLGKFAAALTENPPRDPYVKTLSSPARAAALAKARKGGDALADVARVASLTAASAASALVGAADRQRRLADEPQRLRVPETPGAVRTPTPTPRPAIRVIPTGVKGA